MEFNYLGFCNRLLMMTKRTPVSSVVATTASITSKNSDAYRAQLAINDCIQDLAQLLRIKTRLTEFTFSTTASTRTYTIQKRIIYPFFDLRQKDTDVMIRPYPAKDMHYMIPDDQTTGNPEIYYFEEFSGVSNQPASTGEQVYCVSGSSSDTSVVVIQGYDTNDRYIVDEVTLTGTTAVASTSTFKKIDSISKIETTGVITFRNSGSTTTYLTLAPKETHARFLTIGLHPIPNGTQTIYGKGFIQIPSLVNEYDVPVGFTNIHINAIMAGGLYHFMKYDPAIKNENLMTLKNDYYDEVKKIIAQDADDGILHYMRGASFAGRAGRIFNALNRRTPLY